MIRHENRLLVLVGDHEIEDVVPRVFTVLYADCQEALMHEVWASDTDIRYLLNPDDVVHVQGKKADKRKIQCQVKHVEDVIESKENFSVGNVSTYNLCHSMLATSSGYPGFFELIRLFSLRSTSS